ncbi:tetratricopeptide repeat protein [Winogradskyella flava]|uniref:Tetratricopeptide repeat protein n=1 Tax=Winogradskyella flava TaxID=1884876 RepID=A0A842ITP6_9FLAO|nr:tetratricopeptide repeat protein [Winogradskyella flava]MBC2845146.1 tetratricopeptide repeat protein [Winogradskyella flava]
MNQFLRLSLFIICTVYCAQAQNKEKIVSLLKKLETSKLDTLRVTYLDQLWGLTAYSDPPDAIKYAKDAIEVSKKIGFAKGEARAYQRLGIAYSNTSDYKNSNKAYKKALKFYKTNSDDYRIGLMYYNLAINFKDESQYDSTLYYNNIAESHFKTANDSLQLANTTGLRGSVYFEKGQLLLALQYTLREAEMFKELKDTLRYTDAIRTLASIQHYKGDFKQAIKNFHECISLYKKYNDNYFLSIAYRDLGVAYLKSKPVVADSASFYFNQAIKIANKNSMDYQEAAALAFLGELHIKQDKFKEAERVLLKSRSISQQINNNLSESSALLDLALIYRKQGKLNKALRFANDGLRLASDKELYDNINSGYRNLYEIYKAKSDTKNALFYFEKFKQSGDSLYNIKQSNTINELQIIHETEKKEAELALQDEEIETLNKEVEISNLKNILYSVGMVAFIVIAALTYFLFKQRIKKRRIAHEKETEIYKQKIDFKQRELVSQTLHLVQKKTFMQEIQDSLERIKQDPKLFNTESKRLIALLKRENATDRDWETFKSYFAEVHSDFDLKLKRITSEITDKEIRLAAFLRMNLSTKEIAAMLNVLPDSVKKSKYRLKNKLALGKEADLTQFLNTL